MMTLFPKLLCAAPLLAFVAAWDLQTTQVEVDGGPPAAMAINNCTYYSNASHTQIVGQFGYDCCNNYVAWGKKSKFYECGGCFICFPPPR